MGAQGANYYNERTDERLVIGKKITNTILSLPGEGICRWWPLSLDGWRKAWTGPLPSELRKKLMLIRPFISRAAWSCSVAEAKAARETKKT